MKQIVFLILLLINFNFLQAQKNQNQKVSFFVFDADWNPCKIDAAKFFTCVEKIDDSTYEWRNYNFTGPLISIETYKDEVSNIPHGYFAWYDENGHLDSSGYTFNGKKDKHWRHFTDSSSVWLHEEYDKGKLIKRKDLATLLEERKNGDSFGLRPGEKEAIFKGGDRAWVKYLQNNLQFPERANKLNIVGTVRVSFIVENTGLIENIRLSKSVEYSLDEEAMRLIKNSPAWLPAIQLEKPIKAYRLQPITFAL